MARLNEVLDYKSKYTYDNGVLKNKLNITSQEELEKAEKIITTVKLAELFKMPIDDNKFDAEHYYSIHKFLFDGIYDFAGKVRNDNIYKSYSFCLPQYIHPCLVDTLKKANKDMYNISNEDELIDFLAYYYIELDTIHPFREGNGRTLREFLRQYVLRIDKLIDFGEYYLDYDNIPDRDTYITAVRLAATTDNLDALKDIFRACLVNTKEKSHVR